MISASTASLPHSEAILSSAAFSSSLASSLEQQPRSQQHRQRPHRASFDSAPPPPLRSVDVTEAPHNDSDGVASSVSSPRNGGGSENNMRGSALDILRGASTAHRGGGAGGGEGARQQGSATEKKMASQAAPRQQYTSTSNSDRSTSYTEEASALSATSSPSISSSESLEEDAGDASPTAASSSSPPSATSPERLLALLTPEQLETALELYVDHGGIHANDVPLMLTKLPWYSAPTSGQPSAGEALHHEKVRKKGKNSESGASALLDPEAWLCAVAVAVAAAKGSDTGRCADKKEDGTTAALSTLTQQQQQTFQDRYEASSIVLGQSGGNGSASQYLALKSNAPAAAPLRSGHSPTPTGRKLAFMEEEGEEEEEEREERPFYWVPSQTRASLPELQPRPPSSSLRSQVSPTPLPLSPRPPPAPQHNQPQQPQKQVAAAVPNTTTTSTSSSSRRPPRSSARPRSPRFSSVSPEAQHGVDAPHADRGVSPFSTGAEDAGMRLLFQQCLRTPLAAATSMLSESDWVALVAELRREGHHKLPPQAILDDVTQTISAEVQRVRRPGGLNVADVARILHRQMDEIRTDLTTASSLSGAHGGGAAVEFPAHPMYLIMVAASNNNSAGASRTHRASVSFSSSVRWPSALGGGSSSSSVGGGWRVLPTWCMALAGLFPVEMSAICPVPVVRYLRSVGLMHAVLEAMVQRLDLEVEAMPEATSVSTSSVAASAHHENNRGLQLRLRDAEPSSAAPSSSVQGIPSPTGVSGFIWPPRSHTPTSFPVSGAGFSSAARPASSLAPASVVSHNDSGSWREKPEWRPMLMGGVADSVGDAVVAAVLPTAATASAAIAEGDGLFAPDTSAANVSVDKVRGGRAPTSPATRTLSAGTRTSVRPSTSASRLHDERPVDEIRASVVARAKARRLMDSLRRNTVPINRYECFARVEHEDEPVQEPLCFVSKEELRQTLGHSSSDDGEGSQDSNALSDLIGTLTYDPAAAAAAQEAEARRIQQQQQQQQLSPDAHGGKPYVELLNRVRSAGHRSSLRPPQLPSAAAANVVPNVFSGPSRASVLMLRARTASTRGNSAGAAVAAAATVGTPLGITEVEHRPPPLPPPPPPPPVPGMYRMTGVLLGALPKQQEEALVERLSHPVFDPRTMGLRAASAGAVRPTVAKGSRGGMHPTTSTASGGIKSDAGDQPARAQSAGVRPSATTTTANDSVCLSDDSAVMEQPTATPPLDTTHLSSATKNSATPPRLTNDQHRGFYCFDVPAVLVAQPLSTVAAAAAAAQVIEAAATSPHALAPQPPARTAAEAVGAVARQRGGGRRRHAPLHAKHTATTATHPLSFTAAASRICSAGKGRCPQQPYAAAAAASGAAATRVSARRTASSHASRCTPRRGCHHQQQQRGLTPTPDAVHRSEMTATRENSGKLKTKGRARRGKGTAGEASPGTVHRVRRPDGFGYASEVPRTRRASGSAHDGDTRAFVSLGGNDSVHGVSNRDASANVSHRTDPNGQAPPPVPMSLFERRLLRQLQRAYTLESGGGGGSGRGGGVGNT